MSRAFLHFSAECESLNHNVSGLQIAASMNVLSSNYAITALLNVQLELCTEMSNLQVISLPICTERISAVLNDRSGITL